MKMRFSVSSLQVFLLYGVFCIYPALPACTEPMPNQVLEVFETSPQGYLLFTLGDSADTTSWALTVDGQPQHQVELQSYFSIQPNTSVGSPTSEVLLEKPLDLETMLQQMNFVPTSVTLKLECTDQVTFNKVPYTRILIIKAVSEFSPYFTSLNPSFSIEEDASIGDSLFNLRTIVTDDDVRNFGDDSDIEQFTLNTYTGPGTSGNGFFDVSTSGIVLLLRDIDYEKGDVSFFLNVTVEDYGGLSAMATIQINVNNTNDSPPYFIYSDCVLNCEDAEYRATVDPARTGPITSIAPGPIQAEDPDSDDIFYNIISGSPSNYSHYLAIDVSTGELTLTRSLEGFNVSHFALVVEASDASTMNMSGRVKLFHSVTTSVLVLVPGRTIRFPALPDPTMSAGTSNTEDALFISVIILSILLFLVITVTIVLACLLCRTRKLVFEHDRSNTLKAVTPKHFEVKMRSVHRGSEKEFMRSLSSGTQINEAFQKGSEDDDVFVTDIATYYDLQGVLPQAQNHGANQPPQLIPFHESLAMKEEIPFTATMSTSASHPQTGGRSDGNSVFIYDGKNTRLSQIDANTLESQYQALDLLTSVTPLQGTEDASALMLKEKDLVENTSNTGTIRSLKEIDVISELEEIVASQRVKPPRKSSLLDQASISQANSVDIQDCVTSFTGDMDNSKHEIVPYEEKMKTNSFKTRSSVTGGGHEDLLTFGQIPKNEHSSKGVGNTNNPFSASGASNSERETMLIPGLSGVYPRVDRNASRNSMDATKPSLLDDIAFSSDEGKPNGREEKVSPYL